MKIKKTQKCTICGREIAVCNYKKHVDSHANGRFSVEQHQRHERIKNGELSCIFCSKPCPTGLHLAKHESYCKLNPHRIIPQPRVNFNNKGRLSWNKGLTKETDERVKKYGEAVSKALKGRPGRKHTDATKQKLSDVAKKRNFGGHFYKGIKVVDGVALESSFEVLVAKSLDENNIEWSRSKRFQYVDLNGKKHTYTPDFYLLDYNVYLDPKNDYLITHVNPSLGYMDVDKIKWVQEQNNIKIYILDKNHLSWDKIKELIEK